MLKRLPILLAALALAACHSPSGSDAGSKAPAATPAATPAASATTAGKPAPAAAVTTSSAASSAAPAAAPPAASTDEDATTVKLTPALRQAAAAFHDDGKWVQGKNYFVIQPHQPSLAPGRITITEVFSYGCPACYHAHPYVDKMKQSLPDGAVMTFLSAAFRPDENWVVYQRAYYAAKALGVAERSYDAMFDAVFQNEQFSSYDLAQGTLKPKSAWPKIGDIAKFYTRYGIQPKEFVGVANSFAINTQMKRANELVQAYGVSGTPTFVVDGKYRFDIGSAGGYQQAIELADWLVAKEARDAVAGH